jgi:hypothetical protein
MVFNGEQIRRLCKEKLRACASIHDALTIARMVARTDSYGQILYRVLCGCGGVTKISVSAAVYVSIPPQSLLKTS